MRKVEKGGSVRLTGGRPGSGEGQLKVNHPNKWAVSFVKKRAIDVEKRLITSEAAGIDIVRKNRSVFDEKTGASALSKRGTWRDLTTSAVRARVLFSASCGSSSVGRSKPYKDNINFGLFNFLCEKTGF